MTTTKTSSTTWMRAITCMVQQQALACYTATRAMLSRQITSWFWQSHLLMVRRERQKSLRLLWTPRKRIWWPIRIISYDKRRRGLVFSFLFLFCIKLDSIQNIWDTLQTNNIYLGIFIQSSQYQILNETRFIMMIMMIIMGTCFPGSSLYGSSTVSDTSF